MKMSDYKWYRDAWFLVVLGILSVIFAFNLLILFTAGAN